MDHCDRPRPRGGRAGFQQRRWWLRRWWRPVAATPRIPAPVPVPPAAPTHARSGPVSTGDPVPVTPARDGSAAGGGRAFASGDGNSTSHRAATRGAGATRPGPGQSGPGGSDAALGAGAPRGREPGGISPRCRRRRAACRARRGEWTTLFRTHAVPANSDSPGENTAVDVPPPPPAGAGGACGREAALSAVAALLVACGGSAPEASRPKAHPIDSAKAEQGARGLLGEITGAIDRDDTDGVMTLLSDCSSCSARAAPTSCRRARTRSSHSRRWSIRARSAARRCTPATSTWSRRRAGTPRGRSTSCRSRASRSRSPRSCRTPTTSGCSRRSRSRARHRPSRLESELARQAVVPAGMASIDKVDPAARGAADVFEHGLADQTLWGDDLDPSLGRGRRRAGARRGRARQGRDQEAVEAPARDAHARGAGRADHRVRDRRRPARVGEPRRSSGSRTIRRRCRPARSRCS